MAAVIEHVDYCLLITQPDNSFGSSIHAGASEFGKADIAQAAENGGDGKIVGNNQGVLRF